MAEAVASTTYLRTSIVLSDRCIDVQLPADSPVEDVVYELIRYLNVLLSERNIDTTWLVDADAVWTLEKFGRRQLDPEQSLAEQGVLDGERLWLTKNAKNETYPALIDDTAEAVSTYQDRFPEWKYDVDAPKQAAYILGTVGVFLSVAATLFVGWELKPDSVYRWPTMAALAGVGLLSTVLSILLVRGGDKRLGTAMLSVGYAGIGGVAFCGIPRPPGLWHVAVTAAILLVYAAVMLPLTKGITRLHAAVITASATLVIVCIINFFYLSSPTVIAVEAGTLSYLILLASSKPAMMAGRVETPYVPAAGESLSPHGESLGSVSRASSSSEVIESVVNQEEQNYAAHQYLIGIMLGNLSIIIGGMALGGFFVSDKIITLFVVSLSEQWLLFLFAASIAISLLTRAMYYIYRDVSLILVWSAVATVLLYLGSLAVGDAYKNFFQIGVGAGVFTLFTLVGSLWALSHREIKSPSVRRWVEILILGVYATPVFWLGWMLDVYMKVWYR